MIRSVLLLCTGNKEELIGRVRQYYLDQVGVLYLEPRFFTRVLYCNCVFSVLFLQQAKRENEAKEAKEEGMAVEEGGTEEKGGQDESVDIKREGEGGEEEEESEGEEQKGEKGEEKKKVDGGEKERQGAVEKEEGEGGGIKEEKEDETVIKDEVEDMQTETTEPVTETGIIIIYLFLKKLCKCTKLPLLGLKRYLQFRITYVICMRNLAPN